ncbi:MAG: hypothetical protein JW793_04300 [Acidobacteria bacterium]|nr:hypothetical protein [Acidobacteriota bacterium]
MNEDRPGDGCAQAIEGIRGRLRKKIEADLADGGKAATAGGFPNVGARDLDNLLKTVVEAHKAVGTVNPRHPGTVNELIQVLKRVLQRILRWHTQPIIDFQLCTIRFLHKTAEILSARQSRIDELERKVESLSAGMVDLHRRMEEEYFEKSGEGQKPGRDYCIGGNEKP